ncbi:MAG TPA: carbohydrate binding domain-containing protein [Planctomycetota bacterium]|nr:carbohydrate binding domain-containing protein [Planctomycetota bacterium]
MARHASQCTTLLALSFALLTPHARAQKSAAVEGTLEALPQSLYFVVPAKKAPPRGKQGGLVVVLPGGDGSREFLPWVENALLAQRPDDCTGVLVTAVKWQGDQQIIWPTASSKVPGMQYATDEYVRAVVAAVEKDLPIDPARRVLVAWSSSGPAVYPMLVAKDALFARGYVAMSVWPHDLGDLGAAKGRRFVLDQSPDDKVTPFRCVREAFDALTKAGAVVRLSTYQGGHGWNDNPLPRIEEGLRWLLSDEPAPKPIWPGAKKPAAKGKVENLLANPGFEKGLAGWQQIDNSKRLKVEATKGEHTGGKQSLHVEKTGGPPLDLVTQDVELPEGGTVRVSAQLKSKGIGNAWIKVWLYGADGEAVHKDVDLVRVPADGEWQKVEKSWPKNGAVRATVQVVLVMGGELWLDDVVLTVDK